MIVAVILADRDSPAIDGKPPYLLPLDNDTLIERIVRVVVRGPFGGVVVASAASIHSDVQEALSGFAIQHLELKQGQKGALQQSLQFAREFRARWEKAMAAAAQRFGGAEKGAKESRGSKDGDAKADWSRHRKSPDVKVRGLARSFERDGVMLFRGERPGVTAELQARIVETFARENARPVVQPLYAGERGYPVLFDLDVARELESLAAGTDINAWLLNQLSRIQDFAVDDSAVVDKIESDADYTRFKSKR
jgi:CTP:molybdopterin cytidylyltransferase MocA